MVGTLSFATALQATLREVGAWLVWLAHIVYHFNERELYLADNEVKGVADGKASKAQSRY